MELERPGTEPLKNCAVCDVNFDGSVMVHRKSVHHQRLRRFLNPSCRVCRLEFGSRIERDYHRLSAEHLKALQNQERSLAFEDGDHEVDDLQTIESLDCTVPIGPHQCPSPNYAADEEAVGESLRLAKLLQSQFLTFFDCRSISDSASGSLLLSRLPQAFADTKRSVRYPLQDERPS